MRWIDQKDKAVQRKIARISERKIQRGSIEKFLIVMEKIVVDVNNLKDSRKRMAEDDGKDEKET